VVRWFGTNTDISEHKQVEERLARLLAEVALQADDLAHSRQELESQAIMLRSVLDSMAEGLVAADEQGKFILWNTAAKKIIGLGPANMPSQDWSKHYGLFMADMVTPFPPEQDPLARAVRGEAGAAVMFVRNPEPAEGVWVEAIANPLRNKDGVVHGGVVAFRDITQRGSDEREIRKLNDELEEKVVKRTAQLEAANEELEAFTYSVSHDLRAPLRHISGFAGILVEEHAPALAPEARQYLQRIQDGTQKMGRLVDELLNLARVGRQSVNLQVAGLNSIVDEVVSMLQPEIEGRQVEWRIARLPFVECDPTLMKLVFQNLISNALKYSRPRAHAVIEIGQTDGTPPAIFVRDNGVGFSMKYADKLFGVFQRLHRSEDFEGTGVGLATLQRIVKKHGGQVWAEAELDKGATFFFTLAALTPAATETAAAAAAGGQS
jgi:signal transduction histidine kinase